MNKIDLEFDVVSVDQIDLQSLVVFEINRVSTVVRKTNIGQYIKSRPFDLNFPKSIGRSRWIVLLFLNGQYEAGQPNELINIYLKMVNCERQSAEFKFDIKFLLGSDNATTTMNDQTLCFDEVKTRWIGTRLIPIHEMIKNGSRFIQGDILLLSAHLNEHFTMHVSPAEMSYNNNIWKKEVAVVKSETKNVDLPVFSGPTRHYGNSNNSFGTTPSGTHRNNEPRISDVHASSSSNIPSLENNQIRDSNLNYMDNEFSDDEDPTAKSTESRNSIRNSLINVVKSFFK